jgi:zinc transport system substrate-binding protein
MALRGLLPMILVVGCAACSPPRQESPHPKIQVSIAPLAFLAQRIAGPDRTVGVVVQAGASPHTYDPSPRQMGALSKADVLFLAGEPFEKALVPRIASANPHLGIVDLGEGLRSIHTDGGSCDHGDHPHQHGQLDPHVWMDPLLMVDMAGKVRDALVARYPEDEAGIQARFLLVKKDLETLHQRMKELLAPVRGRHILVYHAAYAYLCERYGLVQVPVNVGEKSPSAQGLVALLSDAAERAPSPLFVQPQYSASSARRLAKELNVDVVTMDPLAPDYLANMESIATVIATALGTTR